VPLCFPGAQAEELPPATSASPSSEEIRPYGPAPERGTDRTNARPMLPQKDADSRTTLSDHSTRLSLHVLRGFRRLQLDDVDQPPTWVTSQGNSLISWQPQSSRWGIYSSHFCLSGFLFGEKCSRLRSRANDREERHGDRAFWRAYSCFAA